MDTILLKPVKKVDLLEYVRYAYPLQFVSHPSPSPALLLDAQGESTFLLVEVTDTPFVLMQPRERAHNCQCEPYRVSSYFYLLVGDEVFQLR